MLNKLLLLFNTLRYLKWRQLYFRFRRKIFTPKVSEECKGRIECSRPDTWVHFTLYQQKLTASLDATFLGLIRKLTFPQDWNDEAPGKLWVYNLHYFEDLLAVNCAERTEIHVLLLQRWIRENPIGKGNGWEPYPTSLRIVNVLKAWLGGVGLTPAIQKSLFEQASFLSNDLERHLLGNHLFVNYKALLFAGVVFYNDRWLEIAEKGLQEEIPEQVLGDGLNFELSPMYHSLILVDMLDMLNLAKTYPSRVSSSLVALLNSYIPRMLSAMDCMSHPDGEVSFFNDSAIGVAPSPKTIHEYADRLGMKKASSLSVLGSKGGYFHSEIGGAKLLFDAAAVGPDYIPGHAHADTLSFELSIGVERVIVNSGISEYGVSQERLRQRSTCAHNTVEVDDRSSSEVWSGFRVARRARVVDRGFHQENAGVVRLFGKHNGYKTMFGGVIHRREILFSEGELDLTDNLDGKFSRAVSRIHFHPDLKLELDGQILHVEGKAFKMRVEVVGAEVQLNPSTWHPQFGVVVPNRFLELVFLSRESSVHISWSDH